MTDQVIDSDRSGLHDLGYAQELKRGMGWFSDFLSVGWAKKWFKGPKVQGTPEELAAIERELDLLERGEKLPDTGDVLPA